jgi:phosphate transport system substrate-binding protein
MPQLIKAYALSHNLAVVGELCDSQFRLRSNSAVSPESTITCRAEGSDQGILALAAGNADIAMLSRPIKASELEAMRPNFPREHVVALDGVLIIVSKRNGTRQLALDEIASIFAGERPQSWNVYVRAPGSGTRQTFEDIVMIPRKKVIWSIARPFSSSEELVERVDADPKGIGFVGYAYKGNTQALSIAQPCGLALAPSNFGVKTLDYPLARSLFLYTAGIHSVHSYNLVLYSLSERAQAVITDAKFVNQSIELQSSLQNLSRVREGRTIRESSLESDDQLIDQLEKEAQGTERLSISFRFRSGSQALDSKALQDVLRLAEYLKNEPQKRKALLLGFADSAGAFESNLRLSEARANEVLRAILAAGAGISPDRLIARGYSELLPVSCNNDAKSRADEVGRAKNRRVEVWLYR